MHTLTCMECNLVRYYVEVLRTVIRIATLHTVDVGVAYHICYVFYKKSDSYHADFAFVVTWVTGRFWMLDPGHSSKHTTSSPCGFSSLSSIVLVPD